MWEEVLVHLNQTTSIADPTRANIRAYSKNGVCDETRNCLTGTDSTDCRDSCQYARDGVCDEPRYCKTGTDTTDCTTRQSSSCSTYTGCCEDHPQSSCGLSCTFYKSCCENVAGCKWTGGYSGGTCSGRPTQNPLPCCGGTCYYNEPATDVVISSSWKSYQETMLNMNFGLQNACSYRMSTFAAPRALPL